MKRIKYFIKFIREDVDISKEITPDDYAIQPQVIEIDDKDFEYYLDIINKSYGEFGDVVTEDVVLSVITSTEDRLESLESALSVLMGV